jgi:hypothetical protein
MSGSDVFVLFTVIVDVVLVVVFIKSMRGRW